MVRPLSLLLPLLLLAAPAHAGTIRVEFSGVLELLEDPHALFRPEFQPQLPFAGHFELDPSTAIDLAALPFPAFPAGNFVFPVTPLLFTGPSTLTGSLTLGSETLAIGPAGSIPGLIFIGPSFSADGGPMSDVYVVSVSTQRVFARVGLTMPGCSISLVDPSGTANSGSFYVPASLEGFASASFGCSAVIPGPFGTRLTVASFSGSIASWVVTPEPSVLAMLFASLATALRLRARP